MAEEFTADIPAAPDANPFAKFRQQGPQEANPFAKFRPGVGQPPQPASSAPDASPGFFDRLWQGMLGKDVSRAGRVGMGVADPFYGGAQIGARMMAQPGGGVPEQAMAPTGPDRTKEVDTAVQQREAGYEQREKAMGLSGGLSSEWARLLGNVASPINLAAGAAGGAAAPASALGRIGLGAGLGAAAGATQPVAGGDFGIEKAKRAFGGAVGGAAGAAGGEVAGSLLGKAIASNDANAVVQAFRRTVRPGKSNEPFAVQNQRILTAIDQVQQNPNLRLTDEAGNAVVGKPPATLRQFDEAIDQTMKSVYQRYDQLSSRAGDATMAQPNPIFAREFQQSGAAEAQAARGVSAAERELTQATARQSQAGNVYSSSAANQAVSAAEQKVAAAQEALMTAQRAKGEATRRLYSNVVDLQPIADKLRAIASTNAVRDWAPSLVGYADRQARTLEARRYYTLSDTQDVIELLNKKLEGFYKAPTGQSVDQARLLAPISEDLREALDAAVTKAEGPGYQALKNQYGALKSIKKDVRSAVQREAAKVPGGLGSMIADAFAGGEALRGILKFSPEMILRGGAIKAAEWGWRKANEPNRAIQQMFAMRAPGRFPPGIASMAPMLQPYGDALRGLMGGVTGAAELAPPSSSAPRMP